MGEPSRGLCGALEEERGSSVRLKISGMTTQERILDYLEKRPGSTTKEVQRGIGLLRTPSTEFAHLREKGLVRSEPGERKSLRWWRV